MPTTVTWLVPGRVIIAEFSGDLSAEAIPDYDRTVRRFLDQGTARQVHYIVNATQMKSIPTLSEMQQFTFPKHAKMGWIVTVGIAANPIFRTVTQTLAQFFHIRLRICHTLDEAFDFLRFTDSTLPDLHAAQREFIHR